MDRVALEGEDEIHYRKNHTLGHLLWSQPQMGESRGGLPPTQWNSPTLLRSFDAPE